MEYIVLDLEWDSAYFPPEKRFLNQILQIGAVKLDENFNIVDSFNRVIKSSFSKRVSSRFSKLTGITNEIMRNGMDFTDAVKEYNEFAKTAEVTMTWSNSDLYTILENEELLLKGGTKFLMNKYLNLQKLVQNEMHSKGYESKNQVALEAAADFLGVETEDYELHDALDDCKLSAKLLKLCYNEDRFNTLVKDTENPDFYARLRFKAYPISDINDSNINPKELKFKCPKCGGKTRRLKNFKYINRWFISDFECKNCKHKFNGRVSFKKTYDDLLIDHKVCEIKPKRKRNNDDMQSVSENVRGFGNRN